MTVDPKGDRSVGGSGYEQDEPWQTQRFRRSVRGLDTYLGRRSPRLQRTFHLFLILFLVALGLALVLPLTQALGVGR
jgi:hypothetical protein